MTRERWLGIEGYDGRYAVSNLGRVWSNVTHRVMKQQNHPRGYLTVSLTLQDGTGRKKPHLVHVLVAEAFVKNPDNKPTVNHAFGDKKDNRASVLEWATYGENHKHAYDCLNRKPHLATLRDSSRPCAQYKDGVELGRWPSGAAAAQATGLAPRNINRAAAGDRKTYAGFVWKYL